MSSLMERMKKGRGQTATVLQQAMQASSGGYQKDERIWKYGYYKSKDTMISDSIIRFLPIPFIDYRREEQGQLHADAVLSPVVHVMRHNFKGSGGSFYNELCRRTIGEECPVNEHDRPLWNAWKEAGKPENDVKKILIGRLPQDEYYANILVIKDAAKPENEGKVFLFKFGAAVKNMIDEAFDPKLPTQSAFDPFDAFEGKNLHLTFIGEERAFGGWKGLVPKDMAKNSAWEAGQLKDGDEAEIESIMEQAYSLQDFIKPELFKSYDELKERFMKVMGINEAEGGVTPQTPTDAAPVHTTASAPVQQSADAPSQVGAAPQQEEAKQPDDDLDEFERMLKGGNF